jgi:DNA-binding MarR family transcriptional regulator
MAKQAAALSPVEVGQHFFELYHRVHRLVDEAMNDAGLSMSRTKVLGVLANHGPIKQAEVATYLGFAPRSVTDTLDALEREGLAVRRSCPNDRRARLVEITPTGSTALKQALVVKKNLMKTIFGGLDETDREQFVAYLVSIRDTLDSDPKVSHG